MNCPHCNGTGQIPEASEVRKLLDRSGKTQREVSKEMGYSAMYLSDLINGKRAWNATLFSKFKAALK